jgi:hypothetical protein
MPAMEDRDEPPGSRSLAVASGSVLLVVMVGVVVGAYAVHNPNHIQLGAWPPVAELVAAATGFALGYGVHAQQRRADRTLFFFGDHKRWPSVRRPRRARYPSWPDPPEGV